MKKRVSTDRLWKKNVSEVLIMKEKKKAAIIFLLFLIPAGICLFIAVWVIFIHGIVIGAVNPYDDFFLMATTLIFVVFALTAFGSMGYENALRKIEEKVKHFRNMQKYCYSCGTELKESRAVDTCPKCNSNLNFDGMLL